MINQHIVNFKYQNELHFYAVDGNCGMSVYGNLNFFKFEYQ